MELPLPLHLFIHLFLALALGYLLGRHFKKVWLGLIFGFLGGFLIDLDHVLEYFFVFGPHFNLAYFIEGRQFLTSDRIRLIFHAWEYLPVLVLVALVFKRRKTFQAIVITIAVTASVHLLTDSFLNNYPLEYYAIFHRAENNYSAAQLLSPVQYEKMVKFRGEFNITPHPLNNLPNNQ
jgi:hypothetical protein